MSQTKLRIVVPVEVGSEDVDKSLREILTDFLEHKAVVDSGKPVIKNPLDPATPGQKSVLEKHNIVFDSGITKAEASRLIKKSMEGD